MGICAGIELPVALPVLVRLRELGGCDVMSAKENENLASDPAALGYPGLSYLKPKRTNGPAESPIFRVAL